MCEEERAFRREILGQVLQKLRLEKGLKVKDVADKTALSEKTINRIEQGKNSTAFDNVAVLMDLYDAAIEDIAEAFQCQMGKETDVAYDFSDAHGRRLKQYSNMKYRCYYFSTDGNGETIDTFDITTDQKAAEGYLEGVAIHKEYTYSCKVVSPADYRYSFVYLTSNGTLDDRAFMILPFIKEIRGKFVAGIGVMLSFTQKTDLPCFQKIVILAKKYQDKRCIQDERFKKEMRETLRLPNTGGRMIVQKGLWEESKEINRLCRTILDEKERTEEK